MNKEEQILRDKAIRAYLGDRELEVLNNIEEIQEKQDKLIAKLF